MPISCFIWAKPIGGFRSSRQRRELQGLPMHLAWLFPHMLRNRKSYKCYVRASVSDRCHRPLEQRIDIAPLPLAGGSKLLPCCWCLPGLKDERARNTDPDTVPHFFSIRL